MNLAELISALPFYETNARLDQIEISNIVMDSRAVKPGNLFVCINGYTVDGHDFIVQAVQNGAQAIIAERPVEAEVPTIVVPDTQRALSMIAVKFYHNPSTKLPLIGITGTNGKTTITYILEKIFNEFKRKTAVIGTIQMKIGSETYPVTNTTPDALLLQQFFKKMLDKGVNQVMMEVSSHALVQGRVYGCDYDIAIFTNLSQDHLDFHKDLDDYLRAKSLLFAQLGNTYSEENQKYAVINQDDDASTLLKSSTAQHVITYGVKHASQVMANNITLGSGGTTFQLQTPIGEIMIQSKLIGMFNVYNMLAASAAAVCSNVPLSVIQAALAKISGVDGRFEPVDAGQSFAVIVDYAHTPDSLDNVLQTVKEFAENNVFVIVGCGGDRDRSKRPIMAEIALKYADQAIFTSDNPRTENPQAILDDMTNGLHQDENYQVIVDRKEAIHVAVSQAKVGDVILIAGKGHETYQQVGNTKYDFDDREVAKEAIQIKEK